MGYIPVEEAEQVEESGERHDPHVQLAPDGGFLLLGPSELFRDVIAA